MSTRPGSWQLTKVTRDVGGMASPCFCPAGASPPWGTSRSSVTDRVVAVLGRVQRRPLSLRAGISPYPSRVIVVKGGRINAYRAPAAMHGTLCWLPPPPPPPGLSDLPSIRALAGVPLLRHETLPEGGVPPTSVGALAESSNLLLTQSHGGASASKAEGPLVLSVLFPPIPQALVAKIRAG